MKMCAYCDKSFKTKNEVHFWVAHRYTTILNSQPVCDGCAIRKQPELITKLTGFIGIKT